MHSKAQPEGMTMWRGRPRPRIAYSTAWGRICSVRNSHHRLLLAVFAISITLTSYAAAQRTAHAVASHSAIPHFKRPTTNFAFNQNPHPSGFRRSSPRTSLPFSFFGDSFNLDDLYASGFPVASQPPEFLLQAANALAGPADSPGLSAMFPPANSREPSPSQPLMIELQNGNYVRVNRTPADGEALENIVIPSKTRDRGFASTPKFPSQELPSVLLVFRDGHSEEVRDYTIAEGTLYARGNYYTDGFWNKKISLATLNVSETLKANNRRNVKFILPKSPNEVITRP